MPMFKDWVPKRIQPWLYIVQVFCIQFSCGVYLGALEAVRGITNFLLEDMLILLYAGLAGMAVWFPMLFPMKFRFTNRQLLCVSAAVIALCNLITMHTTNLAILIPVCFIAGTAKIQGTFECMSNIQLWMSPKRDMGIFFPVLHIILLTAITGSAWLAAFFAFHFTWQMMHVFTIGTMLYVIVFQLICCRPFRPMPQPKSLKGTDFLTAILMCVLLLMICWIVVYGNHKMWFVSRQLRFVFGFSLILLAWVLYRIKTLERPYISLKIFKYKHVVAILVLTIIVEILLGSEHTLEEILWAEVYGLSENTKATLCLWVLPGVYAGVIICLVWLAFKKWNVYLLLTLGFVCIATYTLFMYFEMDVNVPIEHYRWALVIRGCALAIMSITLMWSMHESVPNLQHFFMSLFVFNVLHMYLAGATGYGIYTTIFKHLTADNMYRYAEYFNNIAISRNEDIEIFTSAVMSVSIKQVYGYLIIASYLMTGILLVLAIIRKKRD